NAVAAIHGVAVDGKGHVFVCDRVNKRIGVYDTNSTPTLIASIPCVNPDYIAISKRTGVIYVITRSASAMSLVKFTGWETPGPSVATTQLTTSISTYTGSPSMVLSENGNTTLIWCAYKGFGLRQYSDNGTSFLLVNDLSKTSSVPYVFNNIAVDRKSETAFLLDSWGAVHSIRNWDNPFFARCSTTGAPLKLADMAIGPNSMIYGRYTGGGDNTVGAVQRYRIGSIYAAVPYGNTGSNSATTLLKDEWGTGLKDKGFAAGWQGQLGYITDANYTSGDDNAVFTCPDTGFSGGTPPAAIVKGLGGHCGGLKFDPSGNVYIGTSLRPADWLTNGCYSSDWFYTNRSGSIVKYAPGATGTVSSTSATGAAKVYPQHYGTFAGTGGSVCICRSPRFDVDPYGRLYVPDGAVQSIAIADNAGNTILSFGGYGNVDSRGDLGGGVAGPSIPLGFPTGIATSEDYIYVNDFVNARMLRVKMDYALDNMPGLTLHPTTSERVVTADPLSLSASPNPFTPISNIRVVLPSASDVHLAVYDVSGRLVRELNSSRLNKGVHTFFWRGENTNGQRVSAGLYVYRLTTNNSILTVKALMSR
ncbi:MAG: T9SS type A sorting domain-containing protein, partial [Fibrobacteres bacterium]|nr:T9SS type A sorting domain-containing protein [Fibrobacterota bacterium]